MKSEVQLFTMIIDHNFYLLLLKLLWFSRSMKLYLKGKISYYGWKGNKSKYLQNRSTTNNLENLISGLCLKQTKKRPCLFFLKGRAPAELFINIELFGINLFDLHSCATYLRKGVIEIKLSLAPLRYANCWKNNLTKSDISPSKTIYQSHNNGQY